VRTRAVVVATVIEAIREVQTASGRSPDGIDEATALFGGIEGFESLNGLEVLVSVGARLGDDVPDAALGPLRDGGSPTVGDLVDRIWARTESEHVHK
jgi:hypothetical protein